MPPPYIPIRVEAYAYLLKGQFSWRWALIEETPHWPPTSKIRTVGVRICRA